jgi:hypothetical protein
MSKIGKEMGYGNVVDRAHLSLGSFTDYLCREIDMRLEMIE